MKDGKISGYYKASGWVLLHLTGALVMLALLSAPFIVALDAVFCATNVEGATLPFTRSLWWVLSLLAYFIVIPTVKSIAHLLRWDEEVK